MSLCLLIVNVEIEATWEREAIAFIHWMPGHIHTSSFHPSFSSSVSPSLLLSRFPIQSQPYLLYLLSLAYPLWLPWICPPTPNTCLLWDSLPGMILSLEESRKPTSKELKMGRSEVERDTSPAQLSWGYPTLGTATLKKRRGKAEQ